MSLSFWVEVTTSSCCPTGKVSELMDVQSMLAIGIEAFEGASDADWLIDSSLTKGD